MATFDAPKVRAVAIELKEKSMDLYVSMLPIITTMGQWTLNGLDPVLPGPYAVKIQLDAYKALALQRLKLEEWVVEIQQALPADTLTYPTPPTFFDGGTGLFDGGGEPTP